MNSYLTRGKRLAAWLYHGTRGRIHKEAFKLRLKLLGSAISERQFRKAINRSIDQWELLPFFFDPKDKEEIVIKFQKNFPGEQEKIIMAADKFLQHEFDLLGSGEIELGNSLPWNTDFKTNYSWPNIYWADIMYWALEKEIPYDIKVPWELSRFQWLPTLGQAYWLSGEEKYAKEYVDLVNDWIDKNPPEMGPNWCVSMEVAIRAVNLLVGYYYFSHSSYVDDMFKKKLFCSLLSHGRHIQNHLEVSEAPGNHYVSDGAGLVFLGLMCPDLKEAKQWLETGKKIIYEELRRQILPDGVDYEMSTSYHRLMFELFAYPIILLDKQGHEIPEDLCEKLEKMLDFVAGYTRPDGEITQIGDNDNGRLIIWTEQTRTRINDHRYLLSLGALLFKRRDFATIPLSPEVFWLMHHNFDTYPQAEKKFPHVDKSFPQGGFYRWGNDDRYLLIRHGGVGRGGFGGHSHNDLLSFEWFYKEPILIDPGTGNYTAEPKVRNSFRSASSHNTVVIDNEEPRPFSNDSLFSLTSSCEPEVSTWDTSEDEAHFIGSHEEYKRIGVKVEREIIASDKQLDITDSIMGNGNHKVNINFIFAPSVKLSQTKDGIMLKTETGSGILSFENENDSIIDVKIDQVNYSPSYGIWQTTQRAVLSIKDNLPIKVRTKIKII